MIIRPEQHWFLRLFDWHGSVLSKIIFRLLLNVLMSIIAIISYQWYEQLGIHLTVAPFRRQDIAQLTHQRAFGDKHRPPQIARLDEAAV
ncbi:hypothetical protein PSY40_23005, partial [Shigella flexneri]|nr:hypothetical protein [Shigella flexneri]